MIPELGSDPSTWALICVVDLMIKSWLSRDRSTPKTSADARSWRDDCNKSKRLRNGDMRGRSIIAVRWRYYAMLTCRSHCLSHEVTSEAGLRQIKLTTSCLPHMSVAWPSHILRRSQMIGFMHAMIDHGIDDLVYRNSRSHVLPADMTRVRLRGRGY